MTAAEFHQSLAKFNLTGRQFARLFSVDERTVRRWKAGELDVSRWVPCVLDLLGDVPVGHRDFWIQSRLAGRIGSEGDE
jgi:hypothetical protein